MILAIVAAVCAAIAVGVLTYVVTTAKPSADKITDSVLRQRLADNNVLAAAAVSMADKVIGRKKRQETVTLLDVAGLSIRPAEWAVLRSVVMAGLAVLGGVFLNWIWALVGLFVGWLVTKLWLSFKVNKVRRQFSDTLPDTLQLLAGSLRGGLSMNAALAVVAENASEPTAGELKRVLAKSRLGVPAEDSMLEIADRMNSQDFEWVSLVVRIQKEVGGNLADILTMTADTARERAYIRRQVRTLSAEGRLSSYILIGLPILVGAWLTYASYEYVSLLWTTLPGAIMLVLAATSMTAGFFWMKATVRIEA